MKTSEDRTQFLSIMILFRTKKAIDGLQDKNYKSAIDTLNSLLNDYFLSSLEIEVKEKP